MTAFFWERERSYMKSKIIKWSSILIGVVVFLAIFSMSPIVARANEELYFDTDGNLYYITRERKASSSVKYYTIGWIIKRYDMPIDAEGQKYVIVTKSNYKPDMVDPEDEDYVYCYYRSDKEEILNAIKTVSSHWYMNLELYGDTVYIDSVMTVLQKGEQQGFLYEGGEYTGEVYFDYEGIAGARNWASPESLKVNFGMSVEFPTLYRPTNTFISSYRNNWLNLTNSLFSSSSNGSNDYDIASGIPSGESLYVKSSASKGLYSLSLRAISGIMSVEVKVPVTYILKWTDYYGVEREETKEVNRFYTVNRAFSYYTYVGYEEKKLVGAQISSPLFTGVKTISVNNKNSDAIDKGSIKYEDTSAHLLGYEVYEAEKIGPIVLTSDTYLKPSIPNVDYSSYAEKMVSQIKVRSDKIVIDGKEIMSDDIRYEAACPPPSTFTVSNININEDNLYIDKLTKNGTGYTITGSFQYKDATGGLYTYNMTGLKSVVVHTPVVCNSSGNSDKNLNQAVKPTTKDVVLGSYIKVSFNDFGTHRNIKGYGTKSYTSYVKKRQVRCGFDVVYKGVTYGAGTWIDTKDYYFDLLVCESNKEGTYTIETRTLAYNGADNSGSELYERGANLAIGKYGAAATMEVRLIGRIEKFKLENPAGEVCPKDMPYRIDVSDGELVGDKAYTLKIETVGDIGATDYLEVYYKYYVKDESGTYIPVNVYEVESRDTILGERIRELPSMEIWSRELLSLSGNRGVWRKELKQPVEYILVNESVTLEDIKRAIADGNIDELVIKDKSLYVAAEFVRYKDGIAYISYINEENAKKGYCNMWLREDGSKTTPYGIFMEIGLPETTYYDYEISGTH